MDDKKLQQLDAPEAEAEVVEEIVADEVTAEEAVAEEAVTEENVREEDVLKANVEALREEIRVLEDKQKILGEKLHLAKGKGMNAQIEKCRELLQMLVIQANDKKAELKTAEELYREAKRRREIEELAAEINELTTQIEGEMVVEEEEPLEEPVFVADYDHLAKAKRLSVVSKAVAFVGIFAAFIGALVYMLCIVFEIGPAFSWIDLAIFAGVAVVMIIIGLFIGGAANKHKRIAAEIEIEIAEKRAAYEAELAERERIKAEKEAAKKEQCMDAVVEAYAIEQAIDEQMVKQAKKEDMKNRMIVGLSEVPGKIKEHKKTIVPVAAAATAVVAIAAMVSSGKKKAAVKRSAAVRKELIQSIIDSI